MSLISLHIEQARQAASAFDQSSNMLDDLCAHLQQQWSALAASWEGDSKHETEAEMRALLNRCGQVAQLTKERGVKVTQIADRFQAADENEPFVVAAVSWSAIVPLVGLAGIPLTPQPSVEPLVDRPLGNNTTGAVLGDYTNTQTTQVEIPLPQKNINELSREELNLVIESEEKKYAELIKEIKRRAGDLGGRTPLDVLLKGASFPKDLVGAMAEGSSFNGSVEELSELAHQRTDQLNLLEQLYTRRAYFDLNLDSKNDVSSLRTSLNNYERLINNSQSLIDEIRENSKNGLNGLAGVDYTEMLQQAEKRLKDEQRRYNAIQMRLNEVPPSASGGGGGAFGAE